MLNCNTTKYKGTGQNESLICPKNPYRVYELEDIRAGLRDSLDPMIQAQMGLCGVNPILNSASLLEINNFYCIKALSDTIIDHTASSVAVGNEASLANINGLTIKAGDTLYLPFTELKVVSGTLQAFLHPFN
jgi:hypothetical protein